MPPPQPPKSPAILRALETNARQLQEAWDALLAERDQLRKDLEAAKAEHQAYKDSTAGYCAERDRLLKDWAEINVAMGRRYSGSLPEQVRILIVSHDTLAQQNVSQTARDMRAQGALTKENDRLATDIRLLRQRLAAQEAELAHRNSRPSTVNEAGILLAELVKAKALHERGDDVAYRKVKAGLWERAFGLLGEIMPMHLTCPKCEKDHIDKDERTSPEDGVDWRVRPHKTHLCHHCGHEWRPEERCYTVGVLQTKAEAPPVGPVPEFVKQALAKQEERSSVVVPAEQFDKLTKAFRQRDAIITALRDTP